MSTSTGSLISEETLLARCRWVMRRNEKLLLAEGRIAADFYFGKGEGSLLYRHQLDKLADWMNSGDLRAFLFSMTRHAVEELGYDCMIFASDTWMFQANELGAKLSEEQRHKLTDRGYKKLEKLGYGRSVECLTVTGQTPDGGVVLNKPYFRDVVNPDKVFRVGAEMPPGKYTGGRSAMWGDWNEPGMRAMYERVGKVIRERGRPSVGESLLGSVTLVNIAVEEP